MIGAGPKSVAQNTRGVGGGNERREVVNDRVSDYLSEEPCLFRRGCAEQPTRALEVCIPQEGGAPHQLLRRHRLCAAAGVASAQVKAHENQSQRGGL